MSEYWRNGSGYYDPTAKAAIEQDGKYERERDKNVRDAVFEIKHLLKSRRLSLTKRVVIKDDETGKIYK